MDPWKINENERKDGALRFKKICFPRFSGENFNVFLNYYIHSIHFELKIIIELYFFFFFFMDFSDGCLRIFLFERKISNIINDKIVPVLYKNIYLACYVCNVFLIFSFRPGNEMF